MYLLTTEMSFLSGPLALATLLLVCLSSAGKTSDATQRAQKTVSSIDELLRATQDGRVGTITIAADLSEVPTFRLLPGQTLRGASAQRFTLTFTPGVDGVQLSSDNSILFLDLHVSLEKRAIWNDYSVPTLGRTTLGSVNTIGRVQLLAKDKLRDGHVEVNNLDIISADSRTEQDRPQEYGVSVLQGAFTLWNMQPQDDVQISANLENISVGRFGSPVLGSGIFISGAGDKGGRINVQHLVTGRVHSDGKIAPGTPDQISGGVFTVFGAYVDLVQNKGPVVTYGANDMALDNWGVVDKWIAREKIMTLGPSGIGFVNFGRIGELIVEGPIETYGPGARGFNVYTGTIGRAEFARIVTHGDGAVGVQISQPIGQLIVRRGIETFGATGPSLVKGVLQNLSAIALSIKPGGSAQRIRIEGGLVAHGKGIVPLEQEGHIQELIITDGFGMADRAGTFQ